MSVRVWTASSVLCLLAALASGANAATVLVNGSASPVTVAPGATVSVAISGGPGNVYDWVAKFNATAPSSQYYPDYMYLTGTKAAPGAGMTSATLTFALPSTPGTYNFLSLIHI